MLIIYKRWHFFQAVCTVWRPIEYFWISCKFKIPICSCSSQQNSFPNFYCKTNLSESQKNVVKVCDVSKKKL